MAVPSSCPLNWSDRGGMGGVGRGWEGWEGWEGLGGEQDAISLIYEVHYG